MWLDEQREWPRAGAPVIGVWGERFGNEVAWGVRTEDDGWYAANPDGTLLNSCPAPEMWQHPPMRLRTSSRSAGYWCRDAKSAAPPLSLWQRFAAWCESSW